VLNKSCADNVFVSYLEQGRKTTTSCFKTQDVKNGVGRGARTRNSQIRVTFILDARFFPNAEETARKQDNNK
jgi:hypothetical protein